MRGVGRGGRYRKRGAVKSGRYNDSGAGGPHPHSLGSGAPARRLPLLAGALALLATTLVTVKGFLGDTYWGHDVMWHIPRITEWHKGVADGVLYPTFFHDVFWGNGGPVMLFNPPAPYVLTELFTQLGAGAMQSFQLGLFVGFAAGGLALYALLRDPLGRPAALLAGAAYAIAPYRLLDGWVRAAYPELLATAILPVALLGARRVVERRDALSALLCAGSAALLVLTHAPTTVFGLPLAAAYGLWHLPRSGDWESRISPFLWLGGALAAGVGLTAFYWLPAIAERQYTWFVKSLDFSHYSTQFLWLSQLFETKWGWGYSVPGPDDSMSFQLGWVHAASLLGGAYLAWRGPEPVKRELRFWLAAGVVGAWLTTGASGFVWDHAPLLNSIQFPWRILLVPAMTTAACAGALIRLADEKPPKWAAAIAGGVALLMVLSYWSFATGTCQSGQIVARLTCAPAAAWDQSYSPEALQQQMGADPIWIPDGAPRRVPPGPRVAIAEGDGVATATVDKTHAMTVKVEARGPLTLWPRIFAFPGWEARVDGQVVETRKDAATGQILVDVPAGEHEVRLVFGSTPPRSWGRAISLASLLLGVGAAVALHFVRRPR